MLRRSVVGFVVVALSTLAHGHHSTLGFYDPDRIMEIEGTLKSVSMRNPHIHFVVEVTEPSGEKIDWEIESSALSVLRTRGLDQDFMKVGDRIRVAGPASRRDRPEMSAHNVLLADGTEVLIALSSTPYFAAERAELLEPVFSDTVEQQARDSAEGIFRVWSTVLGDPAAFPMFKGDYPLTEAAQQIRADWNPAAATLLSCWKKGMPLLMISPVPIEFERMGNDIVIRFEEDDAQRLIHMGVEASPPETTGFLGHSTGRWDGNTLVVETVNIDAPDFDDRGAPQSREISLVERFTLNESQDRLDYRITVTDPVTFTRPFDLTRYWVWRPEVTRTTWNCEEPQ